MSRQNGVVLLELREVKDIPASEPWRTYLYLVEGKAIACRIYSKKDGITLLANEEAMRWLATWREYKFAWKALTPELSRSLLFLEQPSSQQGLLPPPQRVAPVQHLNEVPSASSDTIPQRLVSAEQNVMRSLPRNHRRVFALVDGKRSVEKIAAMLKLSSKTVEEILSDLFRGGAIRRL